MAAVKDSVSYSCADPLPQIITYTNSVTNETKTESIPTKINSLHVVFDYSIFHADDVSFNDNDESKGLLETITDTVTDTVNNLFRGDSNDEGRDNLIALEKCMTDNLWQEILANDEMTWVEGDETQCAGLMIDETSRRLQDESNTLVEIEQEEPFVTDGTVVMDLTQPIVIADAGMDQTQPEAIDNGDTNEITVDTPDTSNATNEDDVATTFSGTKLIGIDSLPMDSINAAGCAIGPKTCTSVRGVMSASYIGTNENEVSEVIARMIQNGMTSGSLLCEGSPVQKLEFAAFIGTNYKGAHDMLILNTDRGMAPPPENLTKYGMMFVVFVALLSTGVIVGVLYKRKKMKRKAMGAAAVQDFATNLELEEGSTSDTPDLSVQTEDNVTKMVEVSETGGLGENEVELSLSPKSVT